MKQDRKKFEFDHKFSYLGATEGVAHQVFYTRREQV